MFALGWVLITSYYSSKSDKGSNSSTKSQKEGFLVQCPNRSKINFDLIGGYWTTLEYNCQNDHSLKSSALWIWCEIKVWIEGSRSG